MTWHLTRPASLPACCAVLHMLWLLLTVLSRLMHWLRRVCMDGSLRARRAGVAWCGVSRPSACPPACLPASAAGLLYSPHACFVALPRLHCPCCTALLRLLPLCLLDPCSSPCAPSPTSLFNPSPPHPATIVVLSPPSAAPTSFVQSTDRHTCGVGFG
jgi:hypothetical protein